MTTPPEGQQPPAGPYGAPPGAPHAGPPAGPYAGPPAQQVPYGPQAGDGGYSTGADGHQPPAGPPTDVVSVLGLVLAFLLAPVGLVLSLVGLSRTAGGKRKGRGLAVAGIVVSVVMSLMLTAAVVAAVALGAFLVDEAESSVEGFGEPFAEEPFTGEPSPGGVDRTTALPLGEAVDLDGFRLTVTAVDLEADAAVAAEAADNPPPTGRYVLVSGRVENTATQAQSVYEGLNVAYLSAVGSVYSEFTCTAVVAGAAAELPDLEPGATADVRWCLDVPVDEVGEGAVLAGTNVGDSTAAWADR